MFTLKHGAVLEEEENEILEQLKLLLGKHIKKWLQPLHGILMAEVKSAVNKVNCALVEVETRNLTELNDVMYASAAYVSELAGANKTPKSGRVG